MTQPFINEPEAETSSRRVRGRDRPFPSLPFEIALSLPESILEHGIDGEIQRLTLFEKLNRSPDSGRSRTLLTGSSKYGLTRGTYGATTLSVTADGLVALGGGDQSPRAITEKRFELAIAKFECFYGLYEKVKGHRLPDSDVLGDGLKQFGVQDNGCEQASNVFTANLRYLGLIAEITGNEHVRTIEEVLRQTPENVSEDIAEPVHANAQSDAGPASVTEPLATSAPSQASINGSANGPALHLDIQIHIDASASPDQIDQIFASMARYLYGREQ